MTDVMIPISAFIGLALVMCLFFWFRYRTRSDLQVTIRSAIEKGQELSPEMIDRLGNPKPAKDRDLRLALIWIAIALALTFFGFMIPDDDQQAEQVMMGIAAFPFFIGVAYVIMWRATGRGS